MGVPPELPVKPGLALDPSRSPFATNLFPGSLPTIGGFEDLVGGLVVEALEEAAVRHGITARELVVRTRDLARPARKSAVASFAKVDDCSR